MADAKITVLSSMADCFFISLGSAGDLPKEPGWFFRSGGFSLFVGLHNKPLVESFTFGCFFGKIVHQ